MYSARLGISMRVNMTDPRAVFDCRRRSRGMLQETTEEKGQITAFLANACPFPNLFYNHLNMYCRIFDKVERLKLKGFQHFKKDDLSSCYPSNFYKRIFYYTIKLC